MNNVSLKELLAFAYEVQEGDYRVLFPSGEKVPIHIPDENGYSKNNGLTAIAYDGNLYILPTDPIVLKAIEDSGLKDKGFCVPFSNWDTPEDAYDIELLAKVKAQRAPWNN